MLYTLLNALSSNFSTLVGIVSSVIVLQPAKAYFAIVFTDEVTVYFPLDTLFWGGKK